MKIKCSVLFLLFIATVNCFPYYWDDLLRYPDRLKQLSRKSRYVIRDSWPKTTLKYKVFNSPENFSLEKVNECIGRAFYLWSKYSKLNFKRTNSDRVDIELMFTKSGPNNIEFKGAVDEFDKYATATYPKDGGDIYFDDTQMWTCDDLDGVSLFHVAVHAIGHALGLDHSTATLGRSAMFPYYHTDFEDLDRDDISGIQQIYGIKVTTSSSPTVTSTRLPIYTTLAPTSTGNLPKTTTLSAVKPDRPSFHFTFGAPPQVTKDNHLTGTINAFNNGLKNYWENFSDGLNKNLQETFGYKHD